MSGHWEDDLRNIEEHYLNNGGDFVIAEFRDRIIAMGALRKMDEKTGEVRRMRVHPDHQRKGLGKMILEKIEYIARELGYEKLRLDTSVPQKAAINFYNKNGYREIRRGLLGGYETIYFEKDIS